VKHFTSPQFWNCYEKLPVSIQQLSDKKFALLKHNFKHPSLHLKKAGNYFSVRIDIHHRALGLDVEQGILWFWIGTHAQYDKLLKD